MSSRTWCYVSGIDHVTLRVLVLCIRNFYRYFSISTSRFINTHDCPHRFPFRRSPKYVHLFPHSLTCTPVVLRHYYMLNAVHPAAIGISSGAFGSHGLRNLSPPLTERQISSFSTASSYLIYNGLALLAISFHPGFAVGSATRRYKFAAGMIVGGAVAFSGSIFALVLGRDRFRQLGPVTPLGGVAMIAG